MNKIILVVMFLSINIFSKENNPLPIYTFTDEPVSISVLATKKKVDAVISAITTDGIKKAQECSLDVNDNKVSIKAIAEGINILKIGDEEYRFTAINPPKKTDNSNVLKSLPFKGKKLLSGERFTIVAMGDSVTATGDYETILKMMLERATGNKNIIILDKSYPGRSIDAAVRFYDKDVIPNNPDLGLIMYGLNDQACRCPLDGYLEQCEFLVQRLKTDFQADSILMEPTPHINIFKNSKGAISTPPEYAFRTIGFATALSSVAEKYNIPVAKTFNALWIPGKDISDSAKKMMVFYPPHFRKQTESMLEHDLKGDTIHPNVLGHLMMAKAVFNVICGTASKSSDLTITGISKWNNEKPITQIMVKNSTKELRKGRIQVYSRLECGTPKLAGNGKYKLKSGETKTFDIEWPEVKTTEDFFEFPAVDSLAPGNPIISVADFSNEKTEIYGVPAPFDQVQFVRGRQVVTGNDVNIKMTDDSTLQVKIPKDSQVGRIPIMKQLKNGIATAELAYVKFAQAKEGKAVLDGKLNEWTNHHWSVIGEKCQARWVEGPQDLRQSIDECYISWTVKAAQDGFFIACKVKGDIEKDNFTIFFDTRNPERLGTAGKYYWLSGKLEDDNKIILKSGETSPKGVKLDGKWRKNSDFYTLEMYIPYALIELSGWPEHKDLGLSFWWTHNNESGKTQLQWSEDGHPWNSRWYGVVRLTEDTNNLPFVVRVK